tara:strand:+ start:2663 stop:3310 length:648 start_codon:yes stop_codon:yes gene_type:complete
MTDFDTTDNLSNFTDLGNTDISNNTTDLGNTDISNNTTDLGNCDNLEEIQYIRCCRCRVKKTIDLFKVRANTGVRIKSCISCCNNRKKCKCNKRYDHCKECNPTIFCEHNRERYSCKKCSDPIKLSVSAWISNSRCADKKNNKYDADHFIDTDFCEGLIEDYTLCYYCEIPMQLVNFDSNLATIERLDNKIGHIKSNCVLACRTCNYGKVGDKIN